MGAYYCAICRQTAFNGKGHIFGKHHQSRLRLVLMKFIEKVMELTFRGSMMQSNRECVGDFQNAAENAKDRERWKRMIRCGDPRLGSPKGKEVKEARRTLKKPEVEKFDCTQHKKTFWCHCCDQEVERNVSDGNMTVLHGGLLEHMATPEHRKSTHKFWWENKADPKLKDKVIITHEETQRFKVEVAKVLETFVEQEDEFIKQQAELIRAQEKRRQELLESLVEHEAEPESSHGPNGTETAAEAGVSFQGTSPGGHRQTGRSLVDSMVDAQQQGLTFIGYQDAANSGNVHTGAVPPWFQDDDPLEGTSTSATPLEIGPSCQEFLRQKEQEKLRKLPPNRVGANFDHSSHTDANWLPSFGRVWNSGRRWQSRHQFRQEEGQKNKVKRRMKQGAEGSKKAKMATDD